MLCIWLDGEQNNPRADVIGTQPSERIPHADTICLLTKNHNRSNVKSSEDTKLYLGDISSLACPVVMVEGFMREALACESFWERDPPLRATWWRRKGGGSISIDPSSLEAGITLLYDCIFLASYASSFPNSRFKHTGYSSKIRSPPTENLHNQMTTETKKQRRDLKRQGTVPGKALASLPAPVLAKSIISVAPWTSEGQNKRDSFMVP